MHRIRPGLYIGCRADAYDVEALKAANITHILTLEYEPLEINSGDFKYNFVRVSDVPNEDILSHFPECLEFVEEGIRKGGVLVHCMMGASRSATIVIAYIMQREYGKVDEILSQVKRIRPRVGFMGVSRSATIIVAYLMSKDKKSVTDTLQSVRQIHNDVGPNHGFMDQLRLFEAMGCTKDFKEHPLYKQYKLAKTAKVVLQKQTFDDTFSHCLATDPQQSEADQSQMIYKCKMCRRAVFKGSSIIKHTVGKGSRIFKSKSGKSRSPAEVSCTSVFIEPVAWMEPVLLGKLGGKLMCPKCNARLGSFNWAGDQCSCATWVTPAFKIHCSKVDESRPRPPVGETHHRQTPAATAEAALQ
ncbi:dual specificity protein phosphatase 12-like isoform X1 [Ptychodera flava]|uniref:dual specificity protein phosphatase 12-like isoform X1 n=1 Tax=Ptychodera flava TaxID=63121 RepID=UPI003969DADF